MLVNKLEDCISCRRYAKLSGRDIDERLRIMLV